MYMWQSSDQLTFISYLTGEYVVSVGFPHDAYMILWDWCSKCLLAKVKVSTSNSPICFVRFSGDKSHFITGGKKHLKFWTVKSATRFRSNVKTWALDGKPADLCSFKLSTFVAVTSVSPVSDAVHANGANNSSLVCALNDEGTKQIVISTSALFVFWPQFVLLILAGILCLFYFGFSIRKWIDLKVSIVHGSIVGENRKGKIHRGLWFECWLCKAWSCCISSVTVLRNCFWSNELII